VQTSSGKRESSRITGALFLEVETVRVKQERMECGVWSIENGKWSDEKREPIMVMGWLRPVIFVMSTALLPSSCFPKPSIPIA